MDKLNSQEVKSCKKCGRNKNEKECSTCKKNLKSLFPSIMLSLTLFSFAVYGIIIFVKDMIALFSK
jgi:hypothetical protein